MSVNRVRHRGGPDRLDHGNEGNNRANASPRRSDVGCKLLKAPGNLSKLSKKFIERPVAFLILQN